MIAFLIILSTLTPLAAGSSEGKSLQAIIDAAEPGSVVQLARGVYKGGAAIKKPLTLDGSLGPVIDGDRNGDCIDISAEGVTLRSLVITHGALTLDREHAGIVVRARGAVIESCTITDCLFGISVSSADSAILRGNTIVGADLDIARRGDAIKIFRSDDAVIERNTVSNGRDIVVWFSKGAQLRENEVMDSRYGLHLMYSHDAIIERNTLEDNSVGIFLMFSNDVIVQQNSITGSRGPSGYALGFKDMDRATVRDNSLVGNRVGLYLDNSPQEQGVWNLIEGNLFAWNDIGVASQPSVKRNAIIGNAFVENRTQVSVRAGGTLGGNDLARDGRGNYWSDYAGFDIDGNGIGDLTHEPRDPFARLVDRFPELRIQAFSPVESALDFAARAVPVFLPKPACTDPNPLMVSPNVTAGLAGRTASWPMAVLGSACIGLAVVMTRSGWRKQNAQENNP